MSTQIGDLHVGLGLDASGLQAGLARATAGIEGFADRINKRIGNFGAIPGIARIQSTLAGVGAGLAAAAGAATGAAIVALGGMSVAAMNTAKELENMSRIANATPEEFQRIAYAAGQVGISQEKMSDILKDMNDRVGDFIATGGGPMADFFERIAPKVGVTAQQFRKLSGPDAMQLYVDSLEKANVNQQDFTFFMEAMASDSTALVPLLRNGGKLAQEYGDRLERLGGVMDNRTVASLARMKRSMDEVGTVMRGIALQLGTAFAPALEGLAGLFVSLTQKGGLFRDIIDLLSLAVSGMARVIGAAAFVISSLVTAIWDGVRAAGQWISEISGVNAEMTSVFSLQPVGLLVGLVDLVKATGSWGEAVKLLGEVAAGVWTGIVESARGIPAGLGAVWSNIRAGFSNMLSDLMSEWSRFLAKLAGDLPDIPGFRMASEALGRASGSAFFEAGKHSAEAAARTREAMAKSAEAAQFASAGFETARTALDKLRITTDETDSAFSGAGGSGSGLSQFEKKAGGAKEKLTDLQKVMKSLREDFERLKATAGMTDLQAAIWGKQREAGVDAVSMQGQAIAGLMTQIDGLESLKSAADKGRDSMKDLFGSALEGAGAFKKALGNLLAEMAKVQFTKGMMGLLGGTSWGGGLMSGIGKLLSFDGGGYTWDGPRSGGVDGRGGRLGILHPQETVLDHTKGQGFGTTSISVEAVANPYFDVRVAQISQAGDMRMADTSRRALPGQIRDAQARGLR